LHLGKEFAEEAGGFWFGSSGWGGARLRVGSDPGLFGFKRLDANKYRWRMIYIRRILTHADYDEKEWQK
jgi:hypothetical protein